MVMNERDFRDWVARGDLYVRDGNGYRPLTADTDSAGNLVDMGRTVYHRNHDGAYQKMPVDTSPAGTREADVQPPELPQTPPIQVQVQPMAPLPRTRGQREREEVAEEVTHALYTVKKTYEGCYQIGCTWFLWLFGISAVFYFIVCVVLGKQP